MFITFEGVEGSGKSTQIVLLAEHLTALGYEVSITREPGGTSIGEAVRGLLLDPAMDGMDSRTEALLYAASRSQLVEEVIRPALERGEIVLCDRYTDSTIAYQCFGRGLDVAGLERLSDMATGGLLPDITILLAVEPAVGLSRALSSPADRIESESAPFHERVAAGYRRIAEVNARRVVVIDGQQPVTDVQRQVAVVIDERLP